MIDYFYDFGCIGRGDFSESPSVNLFGCGDGEDND